MAWPQPVDEWYPCLVPEWKGAIEMAIGAYTVPGYTLVSIIWDAIALLYLNGTGSPEEVAFRNVFKVIETTLPVEPPFDRIYTFTPALWQPMDDYLSTSPDTDISNCPIIKFKGNQGGAWPIIP